MTSYLHSAHEKVSDKFFCPYFYNPYELRNTNLPSNLMTDDQFMWCTTMTSYVHSAREKVLDNVFWTPIAHLFQRRN